MRALDVIQRKRNGATLTEAELDFLLKGYVDGTIPEYQISAWLMAVFFQGMTFQETGHLTRCMINSGSVFDLSALSGPLVDKHSTGGVGDKTSLILAPIAAAAGLQVPMMSGRSLGHTGGTLDKLDSISGYNTQLDQPEFTRILSACGFAMTGQTKTVVPADRLLYALRDVTATVESIPLITASILSKKFAEGARGLVFDVKTGSGSFMKTRDRARELATSLVNTAYSLDREAVALITDMDFPLGYATGNFLEIEESWRCLQPKSGLWQANLRGESLELSGISADLMEVTLHLAARMLVIGKVATDVPQALARCLEVLADGSALLAFETNVRLQGGDVREIQDRLGVFRAPLSRQILAPADGFLTGFDAYQAGIACVKLGVGRSQATDAVYPDVGFTLNFRRNEAIGAGQSICTLFGRDETALAEASTLIENAIIISDIKPAGGSLVLEQVPAL